VVGQLLDNGANLETRTNILGQTALVLAMKSGHEVVAKQLLDKGANFEAIDDFYSQTVLEWTKEVESEMISKATRREHGLLPPPPPPPPLPT
jgi:ankyrin repeat protein